MSLSTITVSKKIKSHQGVIHSTSLHMEIMAHIEIGHFASVSITVSFIL